MGTYGIKQVIIVRKDLNMRKGKMCAQVAHASMKTILSLCQRTHTIVRSPHDPEELYPWEETKIKEFHLEKNGAIDQWLEGSFAKVVVSCNSEEELLDIKRQAEEQGLLNALIVDSGATEFANVATTTCLAIGPAYSEDIDKITGGLKLL